MGAHQETRMPSPAETKVTEWLAGQKQAMIDLLREVVDLDSGSYDKTGVDAVGARFLRFFDEHGISAWKEPHEVFGDAVHALVAEPGANEKPILLMGHRDTVFPKGEVARRPFTIEGNRAHGLQGAGRRTLPDQGADHLGRGNRLALVAAGDRTRGTRGPRRL
jgi:hypothetical protein